MIIVAVVNGGPNEAPFPEVIPGEESILYQEPKKGEDLWPELSLLYYVPNVIFFLFVEVLLNMIGLLDCESTCRGISPEEDVFVCADTDFPIAHCF
jgi:hypothetical protein